MTPPVELSLVVPVYNEEANLPVLFGEIRAAVEPLRRPWEVIFVDDGSTDASLAVIKSLAAGHDSVRYLSFAANRGQSAAFKAGFEAARGGIIITMDADLQNDPADIPRLLSAYGAGADMVCGWRAKRKDSFMKRIASKVGNAVRTAMTGRTVTDTGCSLKVMRADMARRLPMFGGMHRFLPTLMQLEGARIVEMKVNHRPRRHGVSKYGTLDRAIAGGYDLIAVRWMRTRHIEYTIKDQN
jgi:glycosyltransferase involved in cell wall biosynthesis